MAKSHESTVEASVKWRADRRSCRCVNGGKPSLKTVNFDAYRIDARKHTENGVDQIGRLF